MNRTKLWWLWLGLLFSSIILTACGDVDDNGTKVSQTVRPVTVIQGANVNNNSGSGLPTDPTKGLTQAAGATSTPPAATPTPVASPTATAPQAPAATTAAGAATTAAGGNTPAPGGTTAAAPAGGGAGDPAAGLKVFQASACVSCHPANGRNAGIGPKLANTTRDEAYIRNNIRNGKGQMPPYTTEQVSDQQLNDLVAYIKNLK